MFEKFNTFLKFTLKTPLKFSLKILLIKRMIIKRIIIVFQKKEKEFCSKKKKKKNDYCDFFGFVMNMRKSFT